jgi:transglutaminase-like putative cysteine protease
MIRMKFSIQLQYDVASTPSDFIFNIHAARTRQQTVVHEQLMIEPEAVRAPVLYTDPMFGNRYVQMSAGLGQLRLRYDATVDIDHHFESPERLDERPISQLPGEALSCLYPSRYCQSDRLRNFATREFGNLPPGYGRVKAIADWVQQRVKFQIGSSNISTSAVDTLIEQTGVCRDFAHVMIALCRAVNIPARFATGIDYGAHPSLGPTDFHAYVEVFLGDRWYLFEPSGISPPMGLVRIGTGRDAADVSFATMFGAIKSYAPKVAIEAIEDPDNGFSLPQLSTQAISTHGEGLLLLA